MNLSPLLGFLWRRGSQITALVSSGKSHDGSSHFLVDTLDAAAPIINQYYPALNAKGEQANGLFDDFRVTLREVLLTPSVPPTERPNNIG